MKNNKIFNGAGKTAYGLVAGLILAGSIASCSSDNSDNIEPSDVAISFTATAPYAPQSRAVVTTNTLSSFRVYGFVDQEIYMNNVKVNKIGNKWQYSPLQYWPIGKSINFYSYSPAIVTKQAPVDNVNSDNPDIPGFINSGTTDLLYGVNMDMSADKAQQVQINFRHALSQLQFQLRRKAGENINVHVAEIALVGTNTVGSFRFPRETTAQGATTGVGIWRDQANVADYTVYTGQTFDLTDTPTAYNSTGFMFAIPQDLVEAPENQYNTGTFVRIKCNITDSGNAGHLVWPTTGTPGYDAATQTAYIYFPLYSREYNLWEPGKAYRYVMNVGVPGKAGVIDFDVTVDEYPNFAQQEQ